MDEVKFPVDIQIRITNDFLVTFKEEFEKVFEDEKPKNPTYWNYYQWHEGTQGFYIALKVACSIHNFMELFNYFKVKNWYDSDVLAGKLTELLYERNLIEEGSINDIGNYYVEKPLYI